MIKLIKSIVVLMLLILFTYLNFSPSLYNARGFFSRQGHPYGGGMRYGFPFIASEVVCSDVMTDAGLPCSQDELKTAGLVGDLLFWILLIYGMVSLDEKNIKKRITIHLHENK